MKRKFVALFMIAIMTLTVATFAVTVTPASAASTDLTECKTPQIDQIQIGRPMVWSPWSYNYHSASPQGSGVSTATSDGSKLAVTGAIGAIPGAAAGGNAMLGVNFHLKGVTTLDQDKALWSKPVTITALVTYKFTGKGSGDTYNEVRLRGGFPGPGYVVSKSSSGTTYTITKTVLLKYSTSWHEVRGGQNAGPGDGLIYVSTSSWNAGGTGGPTYGSADVTVYALGLTWQ